uniref:Serine/threonine protein kinase n=1 Tax=Vitiosangium cumulatum TaxID=1867796 RepID=A0A7D5BH76_9BACT|nr:serine/threonine protein kinase [Vitiosangium cumulatum]
MAGSKLPLAPDDVRGRQMGGYEVLCRLSTGGMAEILLATRRGLAGFHKPVVLKKILPDIQGQEEFVQMFLDEARVTAAFNHPNIAQVFDLDVAGDELFLAMEFVPGATLIEVARACRAANEPMPMGLGLAAARDTALALHYAHTFTDALGQPSPVIHRDVAEKNIMVTYEGVTKLLDFGIAKNLAGASRTQVGMVKGTSGYMSPEQILGEPLDARSDLFSLGVVLHECLTGMRLFPGKAPAVVCNAVLRGPIPEPSRVNKAIPPELDAIVLKALARKRDDRYATTLEFARELERAVGPLIWLPEQSGELLRRLFAERREQTRQLLASGRATTGEVKLAQLFSDKDAPATTPPPAPASTPPPDVAAPRTAPPLAPSPRLPTISAPNFPPPGPVPISDQTDIVSYSVVTRPPAALSGESRSVPPPPPAMAMPPPPPEDTSVQRPAQVTARARPARSASELPTTPASPALEQPRAPARPPPPPPPEPTRTATPEPAPTRARSLGRSESLPSVPPPRAPEEPDLKTAIIRPQRTTPTGEQPVTSGATGPRNNPARPARRPSLSHLDAVTSPARPFELSSAPPAPEEPPPPGPAGLEGPTIPFMRSPLAPPRQVEPEDDGPEFPTAPFLTPPAAPLKNPAEEEELTSPHRPRPVVRPALPREPEEELTASGHPPPAPASRGGLWAVLLLLLVLGGAAALVALRLDGGLVSSRLFPPQPEAPVAREGTPAKAQQAQAQPAPAPPAQEPPAEAQQAQAQTQQAQAQPEAAPPAEAQQAQTQAQQAQAPEAVPAPPQAAPPDEEPTVRASAPEPSQPARRNKATAGSRRKRGASAPTEVESSPEQVTDANEADRAWQALERERSGTTEPPGEKGSLTLATDQYAKVYLGSRPLGETPLFRVSLPPGKHTLRLVGPDGKPLKLLVEIKPGEVTSIRVPLAKLARE